MQHSFSQLYVSYCLWHFADNTVETELWHNYLGRLHGSTAATNVMIINSWDSTRAYRCRVEQRTLKTAVHRICSWPYSCTHQRDHYMRNELDSNACWKHSIELDHSTGCLFVVLSTTEMILLVLLLLCVFLNLCVILTLTRNDAIPTWCSVAGHGRSAALSYDGCE